MGGGDRHERTSREGKAMSHHCHPFVFQLLNGNGQALWKGSQYYRVSAEPKAGWGRAAHKVGYLANS